MLFLFRNNHSSLTIKFKIVLYAPHSVTGKKKKKVKYILIFNGFLNKNRVFLYWEISRYY